MRLILVLAFSSLSFHASPDRSGKQEPTDKKEKISESPQLPSSVPVVVNKNYPEEKSTTSPHQSKDDPDKFPWGDAPTWGLVIVGFVGAWIAIRTVRDINRQTQTLIDGTRSWIMVEVEPVPGAGPIWDGETITREVMDLRAGNTSFTARIICKNDGKVPAWITEKRACLDIVDAIPEIPDWGRTRPIQIEPEPLSSGQIGKPKDEGLECKRPREVGKMVILYGIVKYRDSFANNRTTSFGYKVRDDGTLERLPYPKYNENT